jgi:hypothetical protein
MAALHPNRMTYQPATVGPRAFAAIALIADQPRGS